MIKEILELSGAATSYVSSVVTSTVKEREKCWLTLIRGGVVRKYPSVLLKPSFSCTKGTKKRGGEKGKMLEGNKRKKVRRFSREVEVTERERLSAAKDK